MMPEISYITETDSATFVCPDCGAAKTANVGKFKFMERHIRLKCRCRCGHIYSTLLERRKSFRKTVNLKGSYEFDIQKERGIITIENLSMGGVKFKLGVKGSFIVNDTIVIEFRLDNSQKTLIRRDAVVRWVKGLTAGARFVDPDQYDGLGFYLFS